MTGEVLEEAGRLEEKVILHAFELNAIEELHAGWGRSGTNARKCMDGLQAEQT